MEYDIKDYKHLNLLVCTVDVVSAYFKKGSPAYNCLQAAMVEMIKQELNNLREKETEPLEVNRNIKFPPADKTFDDRKYC